MGATLMGCVTENSICAIAVTRYNSALALIVYSEYGTKEGAFCADFAKS